MFKPFPKSAAGRRTIPLPGWLMPIIRTHLALWPTEDNAPIFANEVGAPLRRTLFRTRIWRTALVRAGLLGDVVRVDGGPRFHDLRHSYATSLVDDGGPPNMVQRVMGHERSSTTPDLYTRRTDNSARILQAPDDQPDDEDPDDTTEPVPAAA
jgi:integrase